MLKQLATAVSGAGVVALVAASLLSTPVAGQSAAFPRGKDGKPDFSGIWQALNTANWDLQDHAARQGPIIDLGAAYSVPGGQGVVEGNQIPYKPEALQKKVLNMAN